MTAAARPLVAHLMRTWGLRSETFVRGQVVGDARTRSLVVARREQPGARALLRGRPLELTTDGLGAVARVLADVAYAARLLTDREASAVAERLRAAGVALLHAHFATDAAFFGPLWRRLAVPRVVSFYGYDAVKAPRRLLGLGRRRLAPVVREFDAFVVPSRDMARDVVALGAPEAKVRVLPWGIDVARFRPEGAAPLESPPAPRRLRVVTVARLIAKKGIDVALRALASLAGGAADGAPALDFDYVIGGDGPLRAELEALARELGLAARVRFAGFVAADALPAFLRDHDLFLHPSVTPRDGDKEGIPTTILEAMACGLPVVATRHGGIPEAVVDGATGLLVAERDVAGLARAVGELLRDRPRRATLGAAGRARAGAEFDAATQDRRRESLYFELLADPAARARRGAAAGAIAPDGSRSRSA